MRVRLFSGFSLALLCWFLVTDSLGGEVVTEYSVDPAQGVDPETGIRVPPGFRATVFADVEGYGRHYATGIEQGPDGEVYISSTVSGRVWRIDYPGE